MIRIGNVYINQAEIAAIYPSTRTEGKAIIALRSGRTVWTMATMEEVTQVLLNAGELDAGLPADQMEQINTLIQLYEEGFRYIARDENGALFAYETLPHKGEVCRCWYVPDEGRTKALDAGIFQSTSWNDEEPYVIPALQGSADYMEVESWV